MATLRTLRLQPSQAILLLVSLERLAERGWLEASQLNALPNSNGHIDYDQVHKNKLPLLEQAANKFLHSAGT